MAELLGVSHCRHDSYALLFFNLYLQEEKKHPQCSLASIGFHLSLTGAEGDAYNYFYLLSVSTDEKDSHTPLSQYTIHSFNIPDFDEMLKC